MSARVILSSDTHIARFATQEGSCSSGIPRIIASSETSCEEPFQSDVFSSGDLKLVVIMTHPIK